MTLPDYVLEETEKSRDDLSDREKIYAQSIR